MQQPHSPPPPPPPPPPPGVAVVVGSLLVLIFNIGVPNDLKGFLFFAQVVGFVYRHGSNPYSDSLSWVCVELPSQKKSNLYA